MTSNEWFSIKDKKARKISLQPEGMECRKCSDCFFFLLFFSFLNLFGIFFYSSVSSIQQTTNTPTTNKQTDMLPTSNIIYSMNKHSLNSDYDKLKQEEVLFVIFFQSNKLN